MNALMSIKEICAEFGLSQVYVRRAILEGKLKSTKVALEANPKVERHLCQRDDVLAWRANSGRNRRSDGRSRYVLYAKNEEIESLAGYVKSEDLGVIITRQNKVKKLG